MFTRKIFATPLIGASALLLRSSMQSTNCDDNKNSAFVFIKPHANTAPTQKLVKSMLTSKGVQIKSEGELTAAEINKGMLIDQHYYAIASKATLLKPKDLPVPAGKFQEFFGISWKEALDSGSVYNAIDACEYLGVDADGLDGLWANAKKVKFGGGFYCGLIEVAGKKPIYVFNAFFMSMRSKFVQPGTSIHYYVVDFSPDDLHWKDFRGNLLGPTNPEDAPKDSIRGKIFSDWESLGLQYVPNTGDNGVHASASPFEGLAERMNWLKVSPEKDDFGSKLIKSGVPIDAIKSWSIDPQVKGKSLFDQLEDTDASECISKAIALVKK